MPDPSIPLGSPARDALAALHIPHAATVGDDETRTKVLLERARHTVIMLESILDGSHPQPDIPWAVAYLRARLAEHYRTWRQRTAELDAAKAATS